MLAAVHWPIGSPRCRTRHANARTQRLVGELRHIEHLEAAQAMALRQYSEDMHRIEQSGAEAILAGGHDGEVHIATLNAGRQRITDPKSPQASRF
jgi:hypothetical protein